MGVVSKPAVARPIAPAYVDDDPHGVRQDPRGALRKARPRRRGCRWQRRATTASRSTGRATRRRSRRFLGTRAFADYSSPSWCPTSTGRRSSRPGSCRGAIRAILEDNMVGAEAQKLFADAQAMLKRMVAEKWLDRHARRRLLAGQRGRRRHRALHGRDARHAARHAAHAAPADRARPLARPRQHGARRFRRAEGDRACRLHRRRSPSPPASARRRRSRRAFEATDDYSRIMLKALADRLAEAFAERLHERVRRSSGATPRPRSCRATS